MKDVGNPEHTYTVLNVTLQDREGGGLHAYSDDLPGLILSGSNEQAVFESIGPAITAIFAHRGIKGVVVRHARPLDEVLQRQSPRDIDVHVRQEQFVVEVPQLAA